MSAPDDALHLHASSVAIGNRGLLIRGAPGTGKSTLALELMARGAALVSDDRTLAWRDNNDVFLTAPEPILGAVEARGIGILAATPREEVPLFAIVDLDYTTKDRLPKPQTDQILGHSFPVFHNSAFASFAPGLVQYLKDGIRNDL